ncbi:MAG: MFS transporter [Dehalococcoidia bacterium]|nr:MFS transporter [Dehalococcoidia bacterium]
MDTIQTSVASRQLRRITYGVAAGSGIASLAMNFWMPLLPLYMQHLGADSKANALFWTAMANLALGLARIVSGPIWGFVSDRIGRKPMFVRTLLCASATIVLVGVARAPWQVVGAFAVQGMFSGFTPAATALISVSVPEERMSNSLSLVTGGQYLGTTIGPALGAALVVVFGFRGSMFAGAVLPIVAALLVLALVPRDAVQPRGPAYGFRRWHTRTASRGALADASRPVLHRRWPVLPALQHEPSHPPTHTDRTSGD